MVEVYFVNPHLLFCDNIPNVPVFNYNCYYDKTEVGMTNFLSVLPSIVLYGFKYAVEVTTGYKVIDGDFRVMVARELNIPVPIVIYRNGRTEGQHYFIFLIKTILRRRVFRRNSMFRKKIKNPKFNKKFNKAILVCKFQKNLWSEEKC